LVFEKQRALEDAEICPSMIRRMSLFGLWLAGCSYYYLSHDKQI